ncbi:hypothetical protein A3D77_05455 [Candidatus Gottesmanbacteria bacterium RIFCSPHIGHO2_02_FULL_39_11]|uniref:Glutamyl-tRNA amidotransferase n=1 Tax=Candidatus Gottesmanbacteria bacterium RIFCSPHIGHO2_02_FULL_39_11 TaxID=1798382 RepID=A0A1F5ZLB8_9BACT|nr:MAG: hypothetical protein A3D77_05455 [Candidatus Gottesmanbacteria bacterium RIFCSPHIGHO2_02_FULL_39_11]
MLKDDIQKKMQDSMKAHDAVSVSALRFILSLINYENIAKGREIADEEIISVIAKEVKKRKESLEMYKSAGRNDLVKKEEDELSIMNTYLPEMMSVEDLEKEIDKILSGISDASNIGKVMGAVMSRLKGKADGGLIAKMVKEKINTK